MKATGIVRRIDDLSKTHLLDQETPEQVVYRLMQ